MINTVLSERILVVDDDENLLFSMKGYLESVGYGVVVAANGEDAITIIRTEKVDLIISDVKMPGGSGVDLLKYVRQYHPHLPIIIQTGRPQVDAAVECIKLGASDYLGKPVDPLEIKEVVQNVLSATRSLLPVPANDLTVKIDSCGTILGGYKIIRTIGEGTFGIIFLAEKGGTNASGQYALKILKMTNRSDDEVKYHTTRFMHEAEAAMRVVHPHTVKIIEYGMAEHETIPYMVMEYIEGKTLRDYIHNPGNFNTRQKTEIMLQIADALDAIHTENICHRDVKPANIIIDENGRAVLTDFGAAKLPESELTVTSDLLGTPSYLSPEGFKSAKVDYRSDIFSFGAVAYEFFLGLKPFVARNIPSLSERIRTKFPKEPQQVVDDFPLALQLILSKMLKKRPQDRYQSASQISADLKEFLGENRIEALSCFQNQTESDNWS